MAEALGPNPTTDHKKTVPMSARIQSPTSPFFVGSNNDQLERAQTREARAAAIRRKPLAANFHPQPSHSHPCLNKHQILDLFHNCIKLASENKINQKNTWELDLIDHLTDIIRSEEGNHEETNFQIASCTLEAGVKIYSLRVDSVHSEAYKVLARMNRAGQDTEEDTTLGSFNAESGQARRKEVDKKFSPLSTLESSFEVLNVKKFDVAFAVDPLYRQMSAQFDEGGAKGLLMNNLGIYGKCRLLFDSLEVPGKCITSQNESDISDTIDLSFARGEEFDAAIDSELATEKEYENFPSWSNDHDSEAFPAEWGSDDADPTFPSYHQEKEPFHSQDPPDMDDIFENVDGYLFLSLGFRSKKNAWAGTDHWKFQKAKGSESEVHRASEDVLVQKTRQPGTKRQVEVDLDFTSFVEKKISDIFSPPRNPKSLQLPENIPPSITKLPEDCHYEPEDLVNLFLLPYVKCIGRKARKLSGEFADVSGEQCNNYESFPSWDNGSVCDDDVTDVHSEMDDSTSLISQPRQINKVEVQYDKTFKQVNVQALKITLWDHIQESVQVPIQGKKEVVSFKHMLTNFPSKCNAAATISDISPHLCFICLLHLANEKGLNIQSCPNLDDLGICLPDDGATITGTV
ncbi:condensin complex subunit 2 isoform X3 [Glycine max]|uniref:condensin complex subunit 2 isoform X3 n=1 Tax=Glycine max TaxID=3847 RepID=UPI0003DEA20A|nr:condensin complex subunit 2 isoform X3 [Glycine max]|eukprot:XP_006592804.1 condensin complex subunit 2 isoform X3 [Glycine max]